MNTTIATTLRRMLSLPALLVILTLAVSWLTAAVAHAQPTGPGDIEQEGGKLRAELTLHERCNPKSGFDYDITLFNFPNLENVPHHSLSVRLDWREQGGGGIQTVYNQLSGFVASDTGAFEARVVVNGLLNGHEYTPFAGEWQQVTVICDWKQPEGGDPSTSLDVEPVCEPEPGLKYTVTPHNLPGDPDHYRFHWREKGAAFEVAKDQSGIVESGEGEFEVRGVIFHNGHGYYTDWVEVTVDCDTPGGGGGSGQDDDIVPGDPNFTG